MDGNLEAVLKVAKYTRNSASILLTCFWKALKPLFSIRKWGQVRLSLGGFDVMKNTFQTPFYTPTIKSWSIEVFTVTGLLITNYKLPWVLLAIWHPKFFCCSFNWDISRVTGTLRNFYRGMNSRLKIPPNGQLLTLTLSEPPKKVEQASPLHHNWLEIKQKTHSTNGLTLI